MVGVVLQPLDSELARANKVAELTRDGQLGSLMTLVYPDSPAAEAGIKPGTMLLRIHAEGQTKPIEVDPGDSRLDMLAGFPWEQYDQIPEQYFDQITHPWPPAENSLTRTLTDLGFGTAYTAEFVRDGQRFTHRFVVTQSPPHFDSAERFHSQTLGLTVRSSTFESRHYLQMTADDPGVIVAKIEPGSKASVASIKPYEIITHVNDQPIDTPARFGRESGSARELRLAVKRMNQTRLVRIIVDE